MKSVLFFSLPAALILISAHAETLATCTGTANNQEPMTLTFTEGDPILQEHDPEARYYLVITTYLNGQETSKLSSNPLQKSDSNPPVYWNGESFESPIMKFTLDRADSLLEVPNTDSDAGGSVFEHVTLNCH